MTRFLAITGTSFLFAAVLGAGALAQSAGGPPVLANKLAPANGGSAKIIVSSDTFGYGRALSDKYTQNGENVSPSLTWRKGPPGTQSYVVLTEDAGVDRH